MRTGEYVLESKPRTVRSSKAAKPLIPPGTLPAAGSALGASLATWKSNHEIVDKGQIAKMIYASRFARNLKLAWDRLRREHVIANNGWTWAETGNGD